MFKVGTKYKNKGHEGEVEVLYVGKELVVLKALPGNPYIKPGREYAIGNNKECFKSWEEVIPVMWRYCAGNLSGNICTSTYSSFEALKSNVAFHDEAIILFRMAVIKGCIHLQHLDRDGNVMP